MSKSRYLYGTVQVTQRTAVFAVRVAERMLDTHETAELAESMREWVHRRGLSAADARAVRDAAFSAAGA